MPPVTTKSATSGSPPSPPPSPTTDTLSDPLTDPLLSAPKPSTTPSPVPAANFKKSIPASEAAKNLTDARTTGASGQVVGSWVQYIVQKVKPPAGPVTATYVSSFDTARGGFSASRTLPDVPDLVVHGHYQRDLAKPREARVNSAQVKWAHDEAGAAPPGPTKLPKGKEPEILGGDHDKVAIEAWEKNPSRHDMRQDAVAKKRSKEKDEPLDLDGLFGDTNGG